jgi:4-diphosphocytidyl-2-C-methyl-D-erythritol kinase
MRAIYDITAPAKLNLFLHITGRRADGYHLLQSAFMLIDWCDVLHVERREDGQISREDLTVPLPADDLTVRAARALQRACGCTIGAHIGVDKRIPAQAGMGGGSSDAASALLALNRLWGLNRPLPQLMEIGLELGADVPFFLCGHNAWVEGIGEKITPLVIPSARFVVLKPPDGLETARIFASPALKRDTPTAIIAGFAERQSNLPGGLFGYGSNDLQSVAETLSSGVAQALNWFESSGLQGRMTGSGSAVFAKLDAGAKVDLAGIPNGFEARVCNNLQAHPLAGWAEDAEGERKG